MDKLVYKTIDTLHFVEIPKIKGSRFFATLLPVRDRNQIDVALENLRKKYYDATHNCYAWRFGVQYQQDLFGAWKIHSLQERISDDGEPTNTAGKPILSVLVGEEIFDILVVVTRYFGGTLLGVGGLIQAYTVTTKAGLSSVPIVYKEIKKKLKLTFSYDQFSCVQYLLEKYDLKVLHQEYDILIQQDIAVNVAFIQALERELIDRQITFNHFD